MSFYQRFALVLLVALLALWLGEWTEVRAPGTAESRLLSTAELLAIGILLLSWISARLFSERRSE